MSIIEDRMTGNDRWGTEEMGTGQVRYKRVYHRKRSEIYYTYCTIRVFQFWTIQSLCWPTRQLAPQIWRHHWRRSSPSSLRSKCSQVPWINYLKRYHSKMSSSIRRLTCKGTLRQVFIRVYTIDWRYSQSCWYFRPSFVNCCPSLWLNSPPHPSSLCK